MLRRYIKFLLAAGLYYTGLLSLYARLSEARYQKIPRILMYHRVIGDDEVAKAETEPGMCITRSMFERQMEYLSKHRNLLDLEELARLIKNNQPIPRKAVVITFDDGWIDNYQNGFDILKKYKVPATIFLPSDFVLTGSLPPFQQANVLLSEPGIWPDRAAILLKQMLEERQLFDTLNGVDRENFDQIVSTPVGWLETLDRCPSDAVIDMAQRMKAEAGYEPGEWDKIRWIMNWDEINQMAAAGVRFGGHGKTHDHFNRIPAEQIRDELEVSKKILEDNLKRPMTTFAYPAGRCHPVAKQLVEESGFECAVAIVGCGDQDSQPDRYALKRLGVSVGSALNPSGKFSPAVFAFIIDTF